MASIILNSTTKLYQGEEMINERKWYNLEKNIVKTLNLLKGSEF